MSIPENVLKQVSCSLSDDGHIVYEPILLKCGDNACKKCIFESADLFNCQICHREHEKKDYIAAPTNKAIDIIIEMYYDKINQNLNSKLKSAKEALNDEKLVEELKNKIQAIEFEIDIRVESLITEIHNERDDLRDALKLFKQNYEKKIKEKKNIFEPSQNANSNNDKSLLLFKQKEAQLNLFLSEYKKHINSLNSIEFIPGTFSFTKNELGNLPNISEKSPERNIQMEPVDKNLNRVKTESEDRDRDRIPPDNNHKHAKTPEPVDKNLNVRNNFSSSPSTVTYGQYNSKIKNDTLRTVHGDMFKSQNSSTDTNKNKPLNSPKLTEQTDPLLAKDKEKDSGIITDKANLYQNKEMKINTNQNNEIAVKKNNTPQKPCRFVHCGFLNDPDKIVCAACMQIV